ncbi:hypothetical protein V6N11_074774 [Hibiscus sabdariffa]|uniref:Uncharacterized protein n=1 Tax=Hibiscus sabdariffa TaxID=183260 RepID=A0ABR2R4J0_9ROSI
MVELDVGSANLGTGDVIAGGLGSSHFPTLQHPQNVGKKVQDPCAILVQPPREVLVNGAKQWSNALIANFLGKSPPLYVFQRTANKLWGRKGSVVIRFLAPEEKYSRKGVVQTNVGTKDRDALNSSSGTLDIGDGGGSVIYEDNVVQTNVVQPGSGVVSIESTVCIPCVKVEPVDIIVPVEVPIVNEGLLGSNKFEALVNTAVEHEGAWPSEPPNSAGRGSTRSLLLKRFLFLTKTLKELEKMTGSGSEAQMDDSKPAMEEIEAVAVAGADCLAPMDTETEAVEVKDHVQVVEDGELMAQPVGDNPDSVERQAVSDQTHGGEDNDKAHNVVVAAADVQNEELLKSGDNGDGEFKDAEDKSVVESVTKMDEIEHDNDLFGSPSAEIKVKPQDDANGVDNQEQTTRREPSDKNPNLCFDNDGSDTEEEQAAFVKEVEAFYKENDLEFKHPKFYKEDLNLLKLWRAVIKLGGYEQVTSCKLWRQVGESFNPPKTCTTMSWTFRIFYEKALLEYEKHKMHGAVLPHSVPSLVEPITVVSPPSDSTQAPGSGRAKRDAAARAAQSWHSKCVHDNSEDKSLSLTPKSDKPKKSASGSLKRKKPSATELVVRSAPAKSKKLQLDTMVVDIGAPADWVKVNVQKTANSYEVYALVPGLLREEVHVQSDPAGRLVISGEPKELDNPWGVTPFKKVVSLPSRIDPNKTSAVVTLHGQLFVRAPF